MTHWQRFLAFAVLGAIGLIGGTALAQSSRVESTAELQDYLFVLNPQGKNVSKGIVLAWIPQPTLRSVSVATVDHYRDPLGG
jgi:hypothetical protein